jgi:hypothetical protein
VNAMHVAGNLGDRMFMRLEVCIKDDAHISRVTHEAMRGDKGIIATHIYSSNKSITNCGMTCTPSPCIALIGTVCTLRRHACLR